MTILEYITSNQSGSFKVARGSVIWEYAEYIGSIDKVKVSRGVMENGRYRELTSYLENDTRIEIVS